VVNIVTIGQIRGFGCFGVGVNAFECFSSGSMLCRLLLLGYACLTLDVIVDLATQFEAYLCL